MDLIAKDLPALIFSLLPGFIAAGVFYTLTAHPKKSKFERVIQALVFTAIIKFLVFFVKPAMIVAGKDLPGFVFGRWNAEVEFQWSIVLAILIGLAFAWFANNDYFHSVMRFARVTTRTSFPSEWYGAFSRSQRRVVLLLDGERRLKGWPEEWPDNPDKGHFIIAEPEWILDDNQVAPLHNVSRFVIPATEVKMVQFLKEPNEISVWLEEIERVEDLLRSAQSIAKETSDGSQTPPTSS